MNIDWGMIDRLARDRERARQAREMSTWSRADWIDHNTYLREQDERKQTYLALGVGVFYGILLGIVAGRIF